MADFIGYLMEKEPMLVALATVILIVPVAIGAFILVATYAPILFIIAIPLWIVIWTYKAWSRFKKDS